RRRMEPNMPYVERNSDQRIVALFEKEQRGATEFLAPNAAEIIAFVTGDGADSPHQSLLESDLAMARVMEDLIDLLVGKNMILLTDLPQPAQEKLMSRRNLRGGLDGLADLVTDGPHLNLVADV
ncbi:MAG: hypothetical protein ACTSWM_03140, partial [Alphaproteobacteria bacterium]